MMNPKLARCLRNLVPPMHRDLTSRLSSPLFASHHDRNPFHHFRSSPSLVSGFLHSVYRPPKMSSTCDLPFVSRPGFCITTNASTEDSQCQNPRESPQFLAADEVESTDFSSEDEDESDPYEDDRYTPSNMRSPPRINVKYCRWGKKALEIANFSMECLDLEIRVFEALRSGDIIVKVDSFLDEHVAADRDQVERYFHEYKKRLDEAAAKGEIPLDFSLEVSAEDFSGRTYSFDNYT